MRTWKNELHFNLKWWALDLNADDKWSRLLELDLRGITVVGCSDREIRAIKKWAADHKIHKLSRVATFESDLESKFIREINNGNDVYAFSYLEKEVCLFDTEQKLFEFELFLDSLPKREMETFVHGRDIKYVKDLCGKSNHRVLQSYLDDDIMAVSVCDKTLFLQLNLVSSELVPCLSQLP